jgi:ferredoxin
VSSNTRTAAWAASSHAPLTIHAERCIHQRIVYSNCQTCVDVCPQNAWKQDDDGLSLDPDLCDHCGQCVAACPHEALSIAEPAPHVVDRNLVLACERVTGSHAPSAVGVVACLHALSADWVIQQARRHHCGWVQLASADCRACDRAPRSQSLFQRWQPVAQRLGSFAPRLECISPTQWMERTLEAHAPDLARRRLFGRILAPRASTSSPAGLAVSADMTSQRVNLVSYLAKHAHACLKPTLWEPEIDPTRCTACMVCVRLCPQGALEHHTDPLRSGELESIELQHTRCTGCGLCTQVCEHKAITVHEPDVTVRVLQPSQTIALEVLLCSQCKAPFHFPAGKVSDNFKANRFICPVCSAGRLHHTQRIVQEFDAAAAPVAPLV